MSWELEINRGKYSDHQAVHQQQILSASGQILCL